MAESLEALRNRVDGVVDLQAVVRTMKAVSASSITQYENAVSALNQYYATVEHGLIACLKQPDAPLFFLHDREVNHPAAIIVFGSDQGFVGQFNDSLAEFVRQNLLKMGGEQKVWVVGERLQGRLQDINIVLEDCLNVPASVAGVTPLVGDLLMALEYLLESGAQAPLYLFHNKPGEISGQYKPHMHKLLPLDKSWQQALQQKPWDGPCLPEALGDTAHTLRALIREYLFVSLYQTCAESLASENASRLVAMRRAEKNIEEMLGGLKHTYHNQRQGEIDAELFDVVAGYSA